MERIYQIYKDLVVNLLSVHSNRAVELLQNFIVQGNFLISEQKLNNVTCFWKDDF